MLDHPFDVLLKVGDLPTESMVFQFDSVIVLLLSLAADLPVLLLLDVGSGYDD